MLNQTKLKLGYPIQCILESRIVVGSLPPWASGRSWFSAATTRGADLQSDSPRGPPLTSYIRPKGRRLETVLADIYCSWCPEPNLRPLPYPPHPSREYCATPRKRGPNGCTCIHWSSWEGTPWARFGFRLCHSTRSAPCVGLESSVLRKFLRDSEYP